MSTATSDAAIADLQRKLAASQQAATLAMMAAAEAATASESLANSLAEGGDTKSLSSMCDRQHEPTHSMPHVREPM